MAQSALKTCEVCVRGPGNQYCIQCEQYLCDECRGLHKRQKISKNHDFQSASSVTQEVKYKCNEHKEDFTFMCIACDTPVCQSCIIGKHNGHKLGKIQDAIYKSKEKATTELSLKTDEIKRSLQEAEKNAAAFDLDVDSVIKAITEEGKKIKDMVDRQTQQMIAAIKLESKKEKDKLTRILNESRAMLQKSKDLELRNREINQGRHDASLAEKLKLLVADVEKLQIRENPECPSITFTPGRTSETDIKQLIGVYNIRETKTKTNTAIPVDLSDGLIEAEEQNGELLYRCKSCKKEEIKPNRPIVRIPKCDKCKRYMEEVH